MTSALLRAYITVPQYKIGNGICLMFTLSSPHQVKYSDCLHLLFKPINDWPVIGIGRFRSVSRPADAEAILLLPVAQAETTQADTSQPRAHSQYISQSRVYMSFRVRIILILMAFSGD